MGEGGSSTRRAPPAARAGARLHRCAAAKENSAHQRHAGARPLRCTRSSLRARARAALVIGALTDRAGQRQPLQHASMRCAAARADRRRSVLPPCCRQCDPRATSRARPQARAARRPAPREVSCHSRTRCSTVTTASRTGTACAANAGRRRDAGPAAPRRARPAARANAVTDNPLVLRPRARPTGGRRHADQRRQLPRRFRHRGSPPSSCALAGGIAEAARFTEAPRSRCRAATATCRADAGRSSPPARGSRGFLITPVTPPRSGTRQASRAPASARQPADERERGGPRVDGHLRRAPAACAMS